MNKNLNYDIYMNMKKIFLIMCFVGTLLFLGNKNVDSEKTLACYVDETNTSTPRPTSTPEPEKTPEPIEESMPTPIESPKSTETPVVRVNTSSVSSEVGAPICTDTAPHKIPNIYVVNAGVGKLEVRWIPTGGNKAHIFYGFEAGKPEHALIDTPNDGVEVISYLQSGKHYWFSVVNGNGCAFSDLSDWYDPIVE